MVAHDIPDLLRQLDGRTVTRFDGTTVVLKTRDAQIVPIEMSLRQRMLSAVAHPNIAYLLLSLGTLALTIELWNPGAILPGVVGGVVAAAGVLRVLGAAGELRGTPADAVRLAAARARDQGHELWPADGGRLVSLIFGSMILMDSPLPELQLSLSVVAAGRPRLRGDRDVSRAAGGRGPAAAAGHRRRRP